MSQQFGQRRYAIALLLLLSLLALIAMEGQSRTQTATASSGQQSITGDRSQSAVADVISVALEEAKLKGLVGDPDEMNIVQGTLSEFTLPGDEFHTNRTVWLVWVKGKAFLKWPGANNRQVDNLYIYIDVNTGQAFQFLAGKLPIEAFNQKAWIKVSKSDIGKFPIPKFVPDGSGADSPRPTATPVQP